MIVKAPEPKFPTCPEGTFPAVCVDEIDLGLVTDRWHEDGRRMVRLVWQIDETMDDDTADKYQMQHGARYVIKQDYTASLHEKSNLRKHLQSWRGRAFTPVELFGFDLDTIVGAPCLLSIVHNTGSKGGTFSNVESVMKPLKGAEPLKPLGYIRVKDRTTEPVKLASQPRPRTKPVEEQPPDDPYAGAGITDDDVPF